MKEHKLDECVARALEAYFDDLDGEPPHAVYDMLLACVEKPLLTYIMRRMDGNQSKAAAVLGLNRNTLRKKLKQYDLQ